MPGRVYRFCRKHIVLIFSLSAFAVLSLVSFWSITYQKEKWEAEVRFELSETLLEKQLALGNSISRRASYIRNIALYVSQHPDITPSEFCERVQDIICGDSLVYTMALLHEGIINAICPDEGHLQALGIDLFQYPGCETLAFKAKQDNIPCLSEPVKLAEGYDGLILLHPVFTKGENGESEFWGFVDLVMFLHPLLQEADIAINEDDAQFALRSVSGFSSHGSLLFGSASVFLSYPVEVSIQVPGGEWALAAAPESGWTYYQHHERVLFGFMLLAGFIISILLGFIARFVRKLRRSERQMRAYFSSMDNLVFHFDIDGYYLDIAPAKEELLVAPRNEVIGKNIFDVLPQNIANDFYKTIKNCILTGELRIMEYSLKIDDKTRWFNARISKLNSTSVIAQVYDITQNKVQQEKLRESENKFRELNETKDRLFSIVAHDIRNPLNTINGYLNLLKENYSCFSEQERQQFINTAYHSTTQTVDLIENLLSWSLAQQGKLTFVPQKFEFADLVGEVEDELKDMAHLKNIDINTTLYNGCQVYADRNMLKTILRNLLSNAIKFSFEGGRVDIETWMPKESPEKLGIRIIDSGVGMAPEKVEALLEVQGNQTSPGTNNEKGSGLGLPLCNDFIRLHEGILSIESNPGEGSVFSFLIPLAN